MSPSRALVAELACLAVKALWSVVSISSMLALSSTFLLDFASCLSDVIAGSWPLDFRRQADDSSAAIVDMKFIDIMVLDEPSVRRLCASAEKLLC